MTNRNCENFPRNQYRRTNIHLPVILRGSRWGTDVSNYQGMREQGYPKLKQASIPSFWWFYLLLSLKKIKTRPYKFQNTKILKKILRASEEITFISKGRKAKLVSDISWAELEARKHQSNAFKILSGNYFEPQILAISQE